jgi:hypothetical protein
LAKPTATAAPGGGFKVDLIKILDSRVVSFRLDGALNLVTDAKRLAEFVYSVTTSQDIDVKKCVIRVRIGVVVQAVLKDSTEQVGVGEIHTETVFHLKQLPKLITQQEGEAVVLPAPIGGTVVGLAYSTTRGIMLSLGAGTVLSRAFLPVVNPVMLLQNSSAEVKV